METPAIGSKQRRPRNEKTHQAILDAAATILQEEGYAGLTIERIAKISGAGKPTIYRWWPNKTAILIELFTAETTKQLDVSDKGSTQKELLAWFYSVWKIWDDSVGGEVFKSIMAEIQSDQEAMDIFKESFLKPRRKLLLSILERAQERGELKERNLDTIVACCWGFNWYHLLTQDHPTTAQIKEVVDTILSKHKR